MSMPAGSAAGGTGSAASRAVHSRLAFEEIHHSYHGRETVRGISLKAEPGEVLCLLGPSGSGKTTLLRIAAGLEAQSHGRVLIDGREVSGPSAFLPPEKRGVGLMFQDFALFPHMTVLDNVRFGLAGLPVREAMAEAGAALERVGLSHCAEKYPHALSGGEQQRVALARALTPRPSVLLMDEPFSGLDSRLKDAVRGDTLAILKESGATAVIVTHDAEEAMLVADRIALLQAGKLIQIAPPDDLYRRPRSLFAASFFSEINELSGRVRNGMVETPLGMASAGGIEEGKPVSVAVRPSDIEIAAEGAGIGVRILGRRFLGMAELLTLEVDGIGHPVRARIRAGHVPASAGKVFVTVDARNILVFEKAS